MDAVHAQVHQDAAGHGRVKGVDHVPGKHLIVTGRSFLVSQRDTPNAADFRQNLADGIHAGVLLVADPFEENHPGLTGLIDQLHP